MYRVAHLVDQREHVVQRALEVQQNHGIHAKAAGRICPAALAGVLIHVNPAVREAFSHNGQILLP